MRVLVTGSSSGIGKAICELFLSIGDRVIGFDIQDSTIDHHRYDHYKISVTDEHLPYIPDIDILVNNAGIQEEGSDKEIDVNLKGTINITEKYGVRPGIKSIVFIASTSASTGAEFPQYAASKGGVLAYMKNVAMRVAKYGATANSISPGGVVTPINRHIMEDSYLYEAVMKESMLGKWAEPEEIAQFVYFVSVVNKSMTGQDIIVDNGENTKRNFIW